MSVKVSKSEEHLVIKFDYSPDRIGKIKSIKGYRWNPDKKEWTIPFIEDNIRKLKELFKNEQLILDFIANTKNDGIINLVEEQLKLKGYSFKTRKSYLNHLKCFSSFIDKDLDSIDNQDVRRYLLFLLEEKKTSHSYANQTISAIKFLCNDTLKQGRVIEAIPRPKRENKLPNVLCFDEVKKILNALENEKHKTILFLVYSAGLRVGEVVRLKPEDIDSKRMLIHVVQGKGRKDRYTLLSEIALTQLRKYYSKYRPEKWLFPGQNDREFLTERSVEKIFEKACLLAEIGKRASIHTLRHYVESDIMGSTTVESLHYKKSALKRST
jgi:integrase/recombinase XerD